MTDTNASEALYHELLARWNANDAAGFGALFTDDGSIVGFDGTDLGTRTQITDHLAGIFRDHEVPSYVAKVRELRPLGDGCMLVRAITGLVPPGADDIVPELNAIQSLVSVQTPDGWRVAHFQNTPARFDGRPEEADALTAELRAVRSGSTRPSA
jgi:uncharacterized protein (TIGR02246 family)